MTFSGKPKQIMQLQAAPVSLRFDRLPDFWDRNCIFFANIHAIFYGNHEETAILDNVVKGVSSYGGRMIPILTTLFRKDGNLLLLEREPDALLLNYFCEDLGITLPDWQLFDPTDYDRFAQAMCQKNEYADLRNHPAEWIDGFVTDESLMIAAEQLNKKTVTTDQASRAGNNKLDLHRFLEQQGLPVFDSLIAESPADIPDILRQLSRMGYAQAVLKAQIGASGCGIERIATDNDPTGRNFKFIFYEGPCLVQGWLDGDMPDTQILCSPSVQIFVGEKQIDLYDLTEQVLTAESVHQGNLAPPPSLESVPQIKEELLAQSKQAATWLFQKGYRGTASADFLVYRQKGKLTAVLCEVNARVTGATYPAILGRRFNPRGAWLLRNFMMTADLTTRQLLDWLGNHDLLFYPDRKSGVIPYNLIHRPDGHLLKGQFVCLGPRPQDCLQLMQQLTDKLPMDIDRD